MSYQKRLDQAFENVPSNAVYWLRNHTAGKEERVFTIQNGEQRFW